MTARRALFERGQSVLSKQPHQKLIGRSIATNNKKMLQTYAAICHRRINKRIAARAWRNEPLRNIRIAWDKR